MSSSIQRLVRTMKAWRLPLVLVLSVVGVAAQEPDKKDLAGKESCATCHADQADHFAKTFHGRKSLSNPKLDKACESCHGPGAAHAADGDVAKIINPKKLSAGDAAELCFTCHKDKNLMMWKTGAHKQNNLSCVNCHSVHDGEGRKSLTKTPTETCVSCHKKQKADMGLASHHPVIEGKMSCVSCHNPHGGIEGNLKADSGVELCAKCHAEKIGPFANEHPPVAESCATCHQPHGSANDMLLKQPQPYLCMSCHRWPHTTGAPPAVSVARFRQRGICTDCHKEIHGSDRKKRLKD